MTAAPWMVALDVARWEFRRWYKPRDQITTFVLSIVIGLAIWGGAELLSRSRGEPVTVVVLGEMGVLAVPEDGRLNLEPAGNRTRDELVQAVGDGDVDGLLVLDGDGDGEPQLIAQRAPSWRGDIETALTASRRTEGIQRLGLRPDELAAVLAPVTLRVTLLDGTAPTDRATRITAIGLVVLMLTGVLLGVAFEFVSITGEKQLRVTEQIVTAIGTQRWIDGKILGTALVGVATMATYAASAMTFIGVSWLVGRDIPLPTNFVSVPTLLALVPIALAGFLFWNTAFAAIAATIDDPNSSARGGFLMLPILPLMLAFLALGNPDTLMARIFALVPITSPGFLAVRMSLSTVPWWEITLALIFLLAGVLLMRRAAGKVFSLGILMYGKEPSWGEILRWIRTA